MVGLVRARMETALESLLLSFPTDCIDSPPKFSNILKRDSANLYPICEMP